MKVLITGTHFTPAQAVIEELKKQPNLKIVYMGRKYTREGDSSLSAESQILPQLGIKFIPIITGRLQRSFTIYTIPSLLKIPIGLVQSFYYLVKESPDVVLAFGGYVSVPVVISAWVLSKPIIIHEQTLVEGLATKINSWFASKVALSFEGLKSKNSKVIVTGNPIRKEILDNQSLRKDDPIRQFVEQSQKSKLPLVLITGGNQGSHIINQTVSEILDNLTNQAFVIHQTGDSKFDDFDNLSNKLQNLKFKDRYLVAKWINADQMGYLLRHLDLAMSRAGINTLQELAYFGVPTLIIPIPYVSNNEQNFNAKFFEKIGLAKVLPQSNLSSKTLLSNFTQMIDQVTDLKNEAKSAKSVIIDHAAKKLTLETLFLTSQR